MSPREQDILGCDMACITKRWTSSCALLTCSYMVQHSTRQENLVGEVFEMLLSLSDFDTFKELMLSYKQVNYPLQSFWFTSKP